MVERPIEEVYAYLVDATNEPRWHADLASVEKLTDGPTGVGTRYRVIYEAGPAAPPPAVIEVTQLQPERRIETQSSGGKLESTTVDELEPDGTRTRVTRSVQIQPQSLPMKVMGVFMGPVVARRTRESMANLKTVVEAR
jgi:uncharacterized membrane protein